MAKEVDPGWQKFEDALHRSALSNKELAERVGEDVEIVTNWKAGRRRPRFADLPKLSAAIKPGNETYLAQQMGIVPRLSAVIREIVQAGQELRRLNTEISQRHRALETTSEEAAARLVSAAMSSGRWAIGVWPAFEGPPTCKLHVSDRLDFIRVDGARPTEIDLRRDFGDLLDTVHAVRNVTAAVPRFVSATSVLESPQVEYWSVPRLLAERPPVAHHQQLGFRSMAVVSITSISWAADVSALLASLFGYGLMSSRAMAMSIYKGARQDPGAKSARQMFHRELLNDPPAKYVWSHFNHNPDFLPDSIEQWRDGLIVVRLRESDRMLRRAAKSDGATYDQLLDARDQVDAAILRLGDSRLVSVDVEEPDVDEGLRRDAKMSTSLETVETILARMVAAGYLDMAAMHALDHTISDANRSLISSWLGRARN